MVDQGTNGRSQSSAWRELHAEGILWDGPVFVVDGANELPLRLITTSQRLAFTKAGEFVLEIPSEWLSTAPFMNADGSVNLTIDAGEGARPERLRLIARDGRRIAVDLIAALNRSRPPRTERALPIYSPETIAQRPEAPVARGRRSTAPPARGREETDEALLGLLDLDDFPPLVEAKPHSKPVAIDEDLPPAAVTVAEMPSSSREGNWSLQPIASMSNRSDRHSRRGWAIRLSGLILLLVLAGAFGSGRLPTLPGSEFVSRLPDTNINAPFSDDDPTPTTAPAVAQAPTMTPTVSDAVQEPNGGSTGNAEAQPTLPPSETAITLGVGGMETTETMAATLEPTATATPTSTPTEQPTKTPMPTATPTATVQAAQVTEPTATADAEQVTQAQAAVPTATADAEQVTQAQAAVPTAAPSPTTEPTSEPTTTATIEPTATATTQPTSEPTATATLEPTATTERTQTPTPEPTATAEPPVVVTEAVPTAEATPAATETPGATATLTQTATVTSTATATPTQTATAAPSPTPTATKRPSFPAQDATLDEGELPAQAFSSGPFRYTVESVVRGPQIDELALTPVQGLDWVVVLIHAENWSDAEASLAISNLQLLTYGAYGVGWAAPDPVTATIAQTLKLDPALGASDSAHFSPKDAHRLALVYLIRPDTTLLQFTTGDATIDLSDALGMPVNITDPGPEPETPELLEAKVVQVLDGQTVMVETGDGARARVRYLGVEAPSGQACYAAESQAANAALVDGQTVYLERERENRAPNSRIARDVWIKGADGTLKLVAAELTAQGAVVPAPVDPDIRFAGWIQAAADAAQYNGLGLWAACGGLQTPTADAVGDVSTNTAPADVPAVEDQVIEPMGRVGSAFG